MNSVKSLIINAKKKGMSGINISDHGCLSGHPEVCKMMDNDPSFFKDFKVTFGSEIYLVNRDYVKRCKKKKKKIKFYHFVLTARNMHGYKGLRIISTNSWKHSFWYRGMRRLPTYQDDLAKLMKNYKGDIIASTACLGSELSHDILTKNQPATVKFLNYLINTFGKDNLYFEIMPSKYHNQLVVNKALIKLSQTTGIKYLISTDSHYIDKSDQKAHKIFLKSENSHRDVADFYRFAHLFTPSELKNYFNPHILQVAFKNSLDLLKTIKPIYLHRTQEIPKSPIPKFNNVDLSKYDIDWSKYPYIVKYVRSKIKANRYYMYELFKGMHTRQLPFNNTYLSRMNTELHVLKAISDYLKSSMSEYFLTMRKIMDICWQTSIVGPGRGSCGCFLINYLLYLNDVNPVKYGLPYWRFLSIERKNDMPDIDFDTESSQRIPIINRLKDYFGHNKVLNFSTFNTQAARSTILTACRGLGINYLKAQNIVDLLPKEKMGNWSIHDTLFGNKKKQRKPSQKFINAIKQYPGLKTALIGIAGKIRGVSQHASGVYVTNSPYINHNAMMKTHKGLEVTQYDAHDSEYCGALKYDVLTLTALDRIHQAVRLLLRDHKIKWLGSFRKTYNHYFSADKLDMTSSKMFDMLFNGDVINAFEFSTLVGRNTLVKLNARTFDQLVAANALMRLTVDKGEQPIDRYIRYRKNINDWYTDMKNDGLTSNEIKIMKEHLLKFHGVCYSQEQLMSLSMDPRITNFNLIEANHLRKSIAKKDHKLYAKEQKHFYSKGKKQGTSKALLDYIWFNCADPAKNYSFNLAHGTAYTIILMVEMNICYHYGPIYWQTACLSVNSGIYGGKFKNPDYSKLDRAMGDLSDEIINPNINKSSYGFVPDGNHILFGLYPISGIGLDDCKEIIKNRPYNSFKDFLDKTSLSSRKIIQLIKSGCFNQFNIQPRQLMIKYIDYIIPDKKRLTTVQIPKIIKYIPKKFNKMVKLYRFRSHITGRYKVPMNKHLSTIFFKLYEPHINAKYGKSYSFKNGKLKINIKIFNKWYNRYLTPLKDWLKTKAAIKCESRLRKRKAWIKYCLGNQSSWEMDSLGCYIGIHELELTNIGKLYNVANINKLPKDPKIVDWTGYYQHKFPVFDHVFIYGTLVGKNANRALVYLLTPNGIANVRIGKQRYVKYNKKVTKKLNKSRILIKDSWFKRGTKLLCLGYKRGNNFFLNKTQTGYKHCLYLIKGYGKHAKVISY